MFAKEEWNARKSCINKTLGAIGTPDGIEMCIFANFGVNLSTNGCSRYILSFAVQ